MGVAILWLAGGALLNLGFARTLATGPTSPGRLRSAAGQGVVLATLGGFRGLAADWLWLLANRAWERREAARTVALLHAAVTVDHRPEYFWVNGARMIAFDLPEWERDPDRPAAVQAAAERRQAERALEFLSEAIRVRGETPGVRIDRARIRGDRLGDLEGAAEEYGRAAELPGAPDYTVRLRVTLLVRLGRRAQAEDWLRDWLGRRAGTMSPEAWRRWERWSRRFATGEERLP